MGHKTEGVIKEWELDEPGGELYCVFILDDNRVLAASGRSAHGTGSSSVSWNDFLAGEMNELVSNTMGAQIVQDIKIELRKIT